MEKELLFSDSIVANDKYVWYIPLKKNILIQIDRNTGKAILCGNIPVEKECYIAYRVIFLYNKRIYLLPYDANQLCIYDIKDRKFIIEDIPKHEEKQCRFTAYSVVDGVAVVSGQFSKILFIDLNTGDMEWKSYGSAISEKERTDFFVWRSSFIYEGHVIIPFWKLPYFLSVNVRDKIVEIKFMDVKENAVFDNHFLYNGKLYSLVTGNEKAKIYVYDLKCMTLEEIELNIDVPDSYFRCIGFATVYNDTIVLFPGAFDSGISIDVTSFETKEFTELPIVTMSELGRTFPYEFNYRNGFCDRDGHIITLHPWTGQLVDLNMTSREVNIIRIDDSLCNWNEVIRNEIENNGADILYEWHPEFLGEFVKNLMNKN